MYFHFGYDPELWAQIMESYDDPYKSVVITGAFYLTGPEDVELFNSGWCPGGYAILHTHKHGHQVEAYDDDLHEAFCTIEGQMREDAFYMGCNAVLGWERKLYWDEPTYTIRGHGTCVVAQKLK